MKLLVMRTRALLVLAAVMSAGCGLALGIHPVSIEDGLLIEPARESPEAGGEAATSVEPGPSDDAGDAGRDGGESFGPITLRFVVPAGTFVTQCESATSELVWRVEGPADGGESIAGRLYRQSVTEFAPCGATIRGHAPLVIGVPAGGVAVGSYAIKCVAPGVAHVYVVGTDLVDGRPSASFSYPQSWPACQ